MTYNPNTLLFNSEQLSKIKRFFSKNNNINNCAVETLITNANKALEEGTYSVIYKTGIAPSGNKHDYWSVAPYWWPNPSKPDGLPYIRKDGVFNPEGYTDKYDKKSFILLKNSVIYLSLAYFFTDDDKYANHCAKLIRTWFIEPDTKMNPNMNYAQGVQGIVNGRKEGVLETERLLYIIDAILLISNSNYWTKEDDLSFKEWLSKYVHWLETDKLAIAERNVINNHGTWYDAQYVMYLIFLGDLTSAATYLKNVSIPRLESQIMPDGKMPEELYRTRPFHYTLYNLEPFTLLAILGDKVGVDLWNYQSSDGASVKKAYDFIVPYILGKEFPYDDVESMAPNVIDNSEAPFARYLRECAYKYNEESYSVAANTILGKEINNHISLIISPDFI